MEATTTNPIDVVISFDTTGSMYPVLTQVRRKVKEAVNRLMGELPSIRIGIIAHGDYCDAGQTYVTQHLDLTHDTTAITDFVQYTQATGGGDAPECYELVLHEAQALAWRPGATRVFVLIGDDVPHAPAANPQHLNWRTEAAALTTNGVSVYAVQALNRRHATPFYRELANLSGGFHLSLDQFSEITDMLMAICYRQDTDLKLQAYEQEVQREGRMSRSLRRAFATMQGRDLVAEAGPIDLRAVPPGRFQVLEVDEPLAIQAFAQRNGLTFKAGKGFYEFTKTETIQASKEIVLQHRSTGDLFAGNQARVMLGLPIGENARIRPTHLEEYRVFVQSTSYNRKLVGGTRFLYEIADYDPGIAA
ncbi:MAG TPA: vWA domain-containing protein [Ktedonosporobacter sp.]|nr:vWA domain-containing protein [Ktedonosporobacter sp.]